MTLILLVNSTPSPKKSEANSHGLGQPAFRFRARPEVWDEFQDKFNIPVVVEFGDLGPGTRVGLGKVGRMPGHSNLFDLVLIEKKI